jgi:hypothetical protein
MAKKVVKTAKIFTVGRFNDIRLAETELALDKCDMVLMDVSRWQSRTRSTLQKKVVLTRSVSALDATINASATF